METSHSAGTQCVPGRSPRFRRATSAFPGEKSPRFDVAQHVSPAIPFSFPTQRISGPASLKSTVVGCRDRKSTRLNSSHSQISYAVFCLKKKKSNHQKQESVQ